MMIQKQNNIVKVVRGYDTTPTSSLMKWNLMLMFFFYFYVFLNIAK
jgi:hypothetical protein